MKNITTVIFIPGISSDHLTPNGDSNNNVIDEGKFSLNGSMKYPYYDLYFTYLFIFSDESSNEESREEDIRGEFHAIIFIICV